MDERIGHYRIVSELGRGGMGVVYKAHEESLNRFVAIKVLGSHLAEDSSYVERFVREAQSAAKLSHPNIVQIYAISEHEGQHYFVMEYVTGTSVQRLLKTDGRMDAVRAERIVLQAAAGLEAAHEQGIIHRDIKPANLMITDRGLVKITDFGLAIALGGAARLTATGIMMGTPGYLSPEQCRDQDIDHRTDIYSLGVTFYEMLTGTMPFTASSPLALIRQIMEVEPPDVRSLNPAVDDPVRAILGRMMAKDREQRYSTCSEVIAEVQRDLVARGVSTPELTAMASAVPPPPPGVAAGLVHVNIEPTMVVESGARPPGAPMPPTLATAPAAQPAATDPVRLDVPPAAQSAAEAPARGRRPLLVAVMLAVVLAAIGAVTIGGIAIWRLGLGQRLAAIARRSPAEPPRSPAVAVGDAQQPDPTRTTVAGTEVPTSAPHSQPPDGAGSAAREPAVGGPSSETAEAVPVPQPSGRGAATATGPRSTLPVEPPAAAAPPPAVRGVAVVAVGETLLAGEAEAYLEAAVGRGQGQLVDERSLPEVAALFGGDEPPPRGALRDALRAHARYLILVRAEYLGERPLEYMGRGDLAYQARLTAVAVDLADGQLQGQQLSRKVEYTHLTVERVVAENLRGWLREVGRSMALSE